MKRRPRDETLECLLRRDARAAELYSMLPGREQLLLEANVAKIGSVEDMERIISDCTTGITGGI